MSTEAYNIVLTVIYMPLYLTAFVGVGLVLRLRRTHPRACWYAVAAALVLFLNWGVTAFMQFSGEEVLNWTDSMGLNSDLCWFVFNGILSAL